MNKVPIGDRPIRASVRRTEYIVVEIGDLVLSLSETEASRLAYQLEAALQEITEMTKEEDERLLDELERQMEKAFPPVYERSGGGEDG